MGDGWDLQEPLKVPSQVKAILGEAVWMAQESPAELPHQAETRLQGTREYLYLLGNKQ